MPGGELRCAVRPLEGFSGSSATVGSLVPSPHTEASTGRGKDMSINTANHRLATRASAAPSECGAQPSSRARRRALLALAGAALTFLTSVEAAPANADSTLAQWQYYEMDPDSCWDAATIDSDFNGYPEDLWFDTDNDCKWDMRIYNTSGGDWFLENMSFDGDENGRPEVVLQDTDQLVGFDYVWYDLDQDGVYESGSTMSAAQADAAATSEDAVLGQQIAEGEFLGTMANMPGFVASPFDPDLKTLTPVGLL